jgi:hypothetical protein
METMQGGDSKQSSCDQLVSWLGNDMVNRDEEAPHRTQSSVDHTQSLSEIKNEQKVNIKSKNKRWEGSVLGVKHIAD